MKAITCNRYGGPDVLQLSEVPEPVPLGNEVLIKVYAVSINDWDWGLFQGDFVNRLMFGLFKPKKQIFGSDVAGCVVGVGSNTKKFKVGDEVFGDLSGRWGGFAEYVCAPEEALSLKPATMSFEEAAAIPQAGMLAVQGLIDKGKMRSGQKLLINGAGGGVGTFGIQMARMHGVEVFCVDNAGKSEMLRSLGAVHVMNYEKEDFTKSKEKFDLILDVKTNRSVFDYLRALKPGGMYVTVGGSISRLLQIFLYGPFISLFSTKRAKIVALKVNKDLEYMKELFLSGKVKPVIDGPYSLEQVPQAFRIFGKGEHKGKMVITIGKAMKNA